MRSKGQKMGNFFLHSKVWQMYFEKQRVQFHSLCALLKKFQLVCESSQKWTTWTAVPCRKCCLHNALSPISHTRVNEICNSKATWLSRIMRSCLLANTKLCDMILTPLLWQKFPDQVKLEVAIWLLNTNILNINDFQFALQRELFYSFHKFNDEKISKKHVFGLLSYFKLLKNDVRPFLAEGSDCLYIRFSFQTLTMTQTLKTHSSAEDLK